MANLLQNIDFGNEAGDDANPEDLVSYFVEHSSFSQFLRPDKKILVATAKKGVGKSALIQWASHMINMSDDKPLVIKCRGADLVRSKFGLTSTIVEPNDYINDWMIRLCALVNRHIGKEIQLALTDDSMTLVETAELDGFRQRDLVGALLDRFFKILGDNQPQKLRVKNEIELMKRRKDRVVWILIDDLDATYQKTQQESLALSTFFSACRYLAQDFSNIFFRATMRTDVWTLIRRYDESLDKMEQYVFDILWSQNDFLRLLYLRVANEIKRSGEKLPPVRQHVSQEEAEERLLGRVFIPKMEWGEREVDTYKVIYTLSYERPRWAIQLCKLAQARAKRDRRELITREDIDAVWGDYGKKRIADLVAEHKHQCSQIEELLVAFRGAERLLPREKLFQWINTRILNHLTPIIEGENAKSPIEVARFLYRIGFIMARSDSNSGYEHYRFDQMPDFLTSRTENDFGLPWEIHPCYREALDIRKLDRSHKENFSRQRNRLR